MAASDPKHVTLRLAYTLLFIAESTMFHHLSLPRLQGIAFVLLEDGFYTRLFYDNRAHPLFYLLQVDWLLGPACLEASGTAFQERVIVAGRTELRKVCTNLARSVPFSMFIYSLLIHVDSQTSPQP